MVGILILLTGVRAYADTSIDASDRETRIKLIPGMNILPDPSGVLTIEDILEPAHQVRFKPITGIGVNLGIVSHPYWFRVVLRNDSEFVRQKALELNNPRLSEVQFFGINSDGVLDKDRAGVLVPESAARWTTPEPAFPLNLLPGGEHTVYLRVDHHGGLRFGANLWERRDYRRHSGVVIGLCAFFVGAIAMVALYNLVVFLDLRERAYLYLALLSVVLCVYVLSKMDSHVCFSGVPGPGGLTAQTWRSWLS